MAFQRVDICDGQPGMSRPGLPVFDPTVLPVFGPTVLPVFDPTVLPVFGPTVLCACCQLFHTQLHQFEHVFQSFYDLFMEDGFYLMKNRKHGCNSRDVLHIGAPVIGGLRARLVPMWCCRCCACCGCGQDSRVRCRPCPRDCLGVTRTCAHGRVAQTGRRRLLTIRAHSFVRLSNTAIIVRHFYGRIHTGSETTPTKQKGWVKRRHIVGQRRRAVVGCGGVFGVGAREDGCFARVARLEGIRGHPHLHGGAAPR